MPDEVQIQPALFTSLVYRVKGKRTAFYPDVKPEQCETLVNVNLTERGTADKRNGYSKYNSNQITEVAVAKAVTGLWQQKFTNAATRNIVVAGSKIYAADTTTAWASLDVSGTAEVGDSATALCRFAYINNQVFGTDGTVRPWQIGQTGNAAILASTIPFAAASGDFCKDFVVHRGILVALNTKESGTVFPTRVRWCDVNRLTYVTDTTSWPDANRSEVYDEGAPIVGGSDAFGRLLVLKEDGLYPCYLDYDVDTGYLEFVISENQVYRGFSPISRTGILSRPEFLWVVCKDGAYVILPTGDGFETKLVTADLQYDWLNNLNQSRLQYAVSYIRERDHQIRTLMSSTTSSSGFDQELVFDWQTGSVWFDEPSATFNYGTSFNVSSVEYDWKGSTGGYVYKVNDSDQLNDDGTPIYWDIKMHSNDLGYPGKEKLIHKVITVYREQSSGKQSIEILVHLDDDRIIHRLKTLILGSDLKYDTGLKYDSGLKYPGGTVKQAEIFVNRIAETVAPRWRGYDAFSLIGYQVIYELLEN